MIIFVASFCLTTHLQHFADLYTNSLFRRVYSICLPFLRLGILWPHTVYLIWFVFYLVVFNTATFGLGHYMFELYFFMFLYTGWNIQFGGPRFDGIFVRKKKTNTLKATVFEIPHTFNTISYLMSWSIRLCLVVGK